MALSKKKRNGPQIIKKEKWPLNNKKRKTLQKRDAAKSSAEKCIR